jgi:uncharacterized protein YaaN involved in tellurite resistance
MTEAEHAENREQPCGCLLYEPGLIIEECEKCRVARELAEKEREGRAAADLLDEALEQIDELEKRIAELELDRDTLAQAMLQWW